MSSSSPKPTVTFFAEGRAGGPVCFACLDIKWWVNEMRLYELQIKKEVAEEEGRALNVRSSKKSKWNLKTILVYYSPLYYFVREFFFSLRYYPVHFFLKFIFHNKITFMIYHYYQYRHYRHDHRRCRQLGPPLFRTRSISNFLVVMGSEQILTSGVDWPQRVMKQWKSM